MLDTTKTNFEKLESRIMSINNPRVGKYNEMREMLYALFVSGKPTLIMATGGSKVVAYYLQLILERLGFAGIMSEIIEPRDYFYKSEANKNKFCNLVVISASGKTNGVQEALDDFKGNKYLICEKEREGNFEVVAWGNELYEEEHSFISLATSLGPISLMLDATVSLNYELVEREIDAVNEKIKNLLDKSRELITRLPFNFKDTNLVQIMSGYETRCSSSTLESNLVETGLCFPIIHDKGSFCHGRSNTLFRNPLSSIIYLSHSQSELDKMLISNISEFYPNFCLFDTTSLDDNYFWKEYFLLLQMYYLSKRIAEDKERDLTKPGCDKKLVKELYNYRGEM